MKKVVATILVLVLQISIVLGYTVTIRVKGLDLVITSEPWNEVELRKKYNGIVDWQVNKGDITIVDDKFIMPEGDVEIEGILAYQLTFDANGGTGSMETQTFSYRESRKLPSNTFTREGYVFNGWATSADGIIEYRDGASYTAIESETLYAIWGMYGDANDDGRISATDKVFIRNYIDGSSDIINLVNSDVNIDGIVNKYDLALVHHYISNEDLIFPYLGKVVLFEDNIDENSWKEQLFNTGETKALMLNTFTKDGCNFIGWSTTPTGAVEHLDGANYTANDNATLYAVWESATPYSIVTIEANGVDVEGEYTNHRCSVCGGLDHEECDVVNIMIEEGFAIVEEDLTETTGSPFTIITTETEGVDIEGEYTNYRCSTCGGTDHECQVVDIMIESENALVEEYGTDSTSPTVITTVVPEGIDIEGEYENHRCSTCGGTDHECVEINIIVEEGNAIVEEI